MISLSKPVLDESGKLVINETKEMKFIDYILFGLDQNNQPINAATYPTGVDLNSNDSIGNEDLWNELGGVSLTGDQFNTMCLEDNSLNFWVRF